MLENAKEIDLAITVAVDGTLISDALNDDLIQDPDLEAFRVEERMSRR